MIQSLRHRPTIDDLFTAADRPELVPLATHLIVISRDQIQAINVCLYRFLVVGRGDAGRSRISAALRVLSGVAPGVSQGLLNGLFTACTQLIQGQIDPYEPPGLNAEASIALAALVQEHPELDVHAGITARNVRSRVFVDVIASGYQRRTEGRGEGVAAFIEAWHPSRAEVLEFAVSCDTKTSAADYPEPQRHGRVSPHHFIRRFASNAELTFSLLAGPIAWFLAGIAARHLSWMPRLQLDYGAAVGIFGLILAVNVVSSELSANRLPGLLARRVSSPRSLISTYSVSLILFVVVATRQSIDVKTHVVQASRLAREQGALLALLVPLLLATILLLVRRTDLVAAVEAYERRRLPAHIRAGLQMGRIQASAFDLREEISRLPFARLDPTPMRSERRVPVFSDRRGHFLPSRWRMRRLGRHSLWHSGELSLRVSGKLGVLMNPGQEIGAVVPGPVTEVKGRDVKRARKALARFKHSPVQSEVAEATATLLDVACSKARHGDLETGSRVIHSMVGILSWYMQGVDRGRASVLAKEPTALAVAPPLRTFAQSLGEQLKSARGDEPEMLSEAAARTVRLGRQCDGLALMISYAVGEHIESSETFAVALDIIRECAFHSLEVGDRLSLPLIRESVARRVRDEGSPEALRVTETAGYFPLFAVYLDYFNAESSWEWFWNLSESLVNDLQVRGRVLTALRVGAAAILSGELSIAIRVALDLAAWDRIRLQVLVDWVREPAVAAHEQLISDFYGRFLGVDAEDAMRQFTEFATRVVLAIET